MNDAGSTTPASTDVDLRLAFFKKLQDVTTKIHATNNLDEIMLDLGMDSATCSTATASPCTRWTTKRITSSPRSRPD